MEIRRIIPSGEQPNEWEKNVISGYSADENGDLVLAPPIWEAAQIAMNDITQRRAAYDEAIANKASAIAKKNEYLARSKIEIAVQRSLLQHGVAAKMLKPAMAIVLSDYRFNVDDDGVTCSTEWGRRSVDQVVASWLNGEEGSVFNESRHDSERGQFLRLLRSSGTTEH
jgi:hypothetical protein